MIEEIKKARQTMQAADESLYTIQNRLRCKESQLVEAKRLGAAGAQQAGRLERDIAALNEVTKAGQSALQASKANLADLVGKLVLPQSPRELISQLDDGLPFLLFPVRMETRFMHGAARELWVRVYPDDIAVHTHEKELTRDEADSAVDYWIQQTDGAWRALVNSYGETRAAWITDKIKRRVIDKEGSESFSFMQIRLQVSSILADRRADPAGKRAAITVLLNSDHPLIPLIRDRILALLAADEEIGDTTRAAIVQTIEDGILNYLGFDLEALKAESWSRAPRSEVMPDRFVLIGFNGTARLEQPFPNAVPNPLILGPNPQNLETELSQQGGELVMGEDFDWIANFDKAIQLGMAMRVTLTEPFASQGFDRLIVLGIRVSSSAAEHRELLEELIDNHRYSPDGMSFLPPGTPTNNTSEVRSGFSTDGEGTESPIESTDDELDKTDAQRLAAAWDVDLEKLAPLPHAGRKDVSQAKIMNRALWPATLGYYFEELLEIAPGVIGNIRQFFADHVVARGSLPAIRVGKEPYGILVTSAFRRWQVNPSVDGEHFSFLGQAHDTLRAAEDQWQQLVPQVAHVDAPGDSFAKLLDVLGLHATSVDFARRLGTHRNLVWNVAHLQQGANFSNTSPAANYFQQVEARGSELIGQLGFGFSGRPKLFGLLFSDGTSGINGPLVDDVDLPGDEKLSETTELPARYAVKITESDGESVEQKNYIGWLISTDLNTLKQQQFFKDNGEQLPIPKALLYRMLYRSLSLSTFLAAMTVYEGFQLVGNTVRREQDFTNVEQGRTVTRWEFMEANVGRVLPQLSDANVTLGDFLATADVATVPAAFPLQEVRESIGLLEHLKTAELERLFAEHIDLCSYRLDAWQTALFSARLERLNELRASDGVEIARRGIHLGAYGWLENVRPAPPPVPVPDSEIPPALRQDGVTVVEQPDNGGYIHGPSINHAVAAAVLRNAYITHADQNNADHFAVRLTSARVRTALTFLDGVRNGQQLGALLGYQFERALHDRYVINGVALEQFILAFRKKYPMVADKITPGATADAIKQKEAFQVIDGYALLEAVLLRNPPLQYPYGVEGLPTDTNDAARQAIIAEVERLKDTLDSIADLSLAEGVFQVTQGNYERAGAMLKSLSEGNAPPDPDIVRTPRSGAVVNHKVAVHFETGNVASPWSVPSTPKSLAAPGLNKWLGDLVGQPDTLRFSVHYDLDDTVTVISLEELALQPLDLIYLIKNQAGGVEGEEQISDLTELEARIDFAFRTKRKSEDPNFDPSGRAKIRFISREGFPVSGPAIRTLFELLPLLRSLQSLVTGSRPLGADDYMLPSEEKADPNSSDNPKRWDLSGMEESFDQAAAGLDHALQMLEGIAPSFSDPSGIDYDALRSALIALSYFGLPGAFPKTVLPDKSLIEQALLTIDQGRSRHSRAVRLRTFGNLSPEEINRLTVARKADIYQAAAALVLGDSFRLIPTFQFKNLPELNAAHDFANAAANESLMRFTQSRLKATANSEIQDWRGLAVEEWLQGVAAVREKVAPLDAMNTYQQAFADQELTFKPLQLPFDKQAHWVALEFPADVFAPQGDFLSIVRQLSEAYQITAAQSGLLIDEWNEVIPNKAETTGIAIHYNQPNTEPPQCILLAVSPNVNGRWEWDDLVDTLIDTFDRAKRRAVEPDFLRTTPYAQLLPAILSSFTSYPFGTVSTNFAAQPVSMVLDQT